MLATVSYALVTHQLCVSYALVTVSYVLATVSYALATC